MEFLLFVIQMLYGSQLKNSEYKSSVKMMGCDGELSQLSVSIRPPPNLCESTKAEGKAPAKLLRSLVFSPPTPNRTGFEEDLDLT